MESESIRLRPMSRNTNPSDGFRVDQFTPQKRTATKVPYKSIVLAISLFTLGSVLLIVGSLLVAGIIIPEKYADRTIPVIVLGVITFLPGSYHTYVAWAAYRQYAGYSYMDIPSFDD